MLPAVICKHRLRASCEPKKVFCSHLGRAEQFTCVQLDVSDVSIRILAEMKFILTCSYLRVPGTCSVCVKK
jgi:hypothetical protein